MIIKTKIVATIGPASWDTPILHRLAKAGVDVFRINFSHGTRQEQERTLRNIRAVQEELGEPLAVMADLCGPKIRVGAMADGSAKLVEGSEIIIQRKPVEGTAKRISTTLTELIDSARKGHKILLDDGKLVLQVVRSDAPKQIVCKVVTGGVLSSGKGVNLPGMRLACSAMTEKDVADARWIAKQDFDYVALSFVQRASDVKGLGKLLTSAGSDAKIIAKIEKPQAMKNIDAIIDAADGILVARGDMGVELSLPEVPFVQKRLVGLCAQAGKTCIIATQMLESMTTAPTPTRAEVSDVANAVLDGADAVMLSGETAIGKYPEKTVRMMNTIAGKAEGHLAGQALGHVGRRQDDLLPGAGAPGGDGKAVANRRMRVGGDRLAIVRAARTLVYSEQVKAVVAFTMSGLTAQLLAKLRMPVPILALTTTPRVTQQACMLYGVTSRQAPLVEHTRDVLALAGAEVRKLRWAKKGDKIVVVSGRPIGKPGTINTLVIHTV